MDIDELRLRGNNLYSIRDYNSAIDVYTQALEVSPGNAIILGNRSACFLAVGQPENAEYDARLAISIEPTFIKCYFRLATALKARGALQEAIEVTELGLIQDPQAAALKNLKSACVKEQQQQQQAEAAVATAAAAKAASSSTNGGNGSNGAGETAAGKAGSASAIKRGFLHGSGGKMFGGGKDHAKENDHDSNSGEAQTERRMHTELKLLIKKVATGGFGPDDMKKHMLQGVFKQLMEKETFAEVLFPGAPRAVLRDLPKNMKELLAWDILSLDLTKIARKAASVFDGIKTKGAERGEYMDATSEAILVPQIVEEAFARDVVETVRNLGKKVSGLNAKVSLSLALPSEDEASWDQIEMEVSNALGSKENALGVQPEFLGDEWAALVLEDVLRFVRDEKMSDMNTCNSLSLPTDGADAAACASSKTVPAPVVNSTSSSSSSGGSSSNNNGSTSGNSESSPGPPRMAWIEGDDLTTPYPALADLVQQLHALPYEINAKSDCALRLLRPSRGCTMLAYYPEGSQQALRLDNREGEFDSGIRVTCAYHLVPAMVESKATDADGSSSSSSSNGSKPRRAQVAAQLVYAVADGSGLGKSTASAAAKHEPLDEAGPGSGGPGPGGPGPGRGLQRVDIEHDQLVVHQSLKVQNARSKAKEAYFAVYFFIHGK